MSGPETDAEPEAGTDAPKRRSIRANTLSQVGPLVIGYGLSFISIPIVLAGLGLADFGVWAITGALAQYASLLDLGVTYSVARYIALHEAAGDRRAQGQVMTTAFIALLGLGLALWLLSLVIAGPLARSLGRDDEDVVRWVLQCGVAILTLTLLTRAIGAFGIGRERMDAPNRGLMLGQVVQFVAVVISISFAPRLTVFATANLVAAAIGLVAMAVIVGRREQGIPFAMPTRARAREMFGFAFRAQFVQLGDLIIFESDKVIVGIMVSPAAAGAYEIGSRFALAVRHVSLIPLGALIGPLTADIATRGNAAVHERYRHLAGRAVATGFPVLALGAASAATFLVVWLGDVPQYSTVVVVVLCLANVANIATGVATTAANAAGRPGLPAIAAIVTATVNLALSLLLGRLFGVWGVLAATAAATVLGGALTLALVHRSFGLSNAGFLRAMVRPVAVATLAAVPVVALGLLAPGGRVEAAVVLAVAVAAFAAVYAVVGVRTGILPPVGPLGALARGRTATPAPAEG